MGQPSTSTPTPSATLPEADRLRAPFAEVCERLMARPYRVRAQYQPDPRAAAWDVLCESFGARYRDCTLASFETHGTDADRARQAAVLDSLVKYTASIRERVAAGENIIAFGPPGSGKDHLLVALLREAVRAHLSCRWVNGQDMYGSFRDAIDTGRSEASIIDQCSQPAVLVVSDPVPPKGQQSDYAATMLYRIIDRRYRQRRSTWVSANIATELDGRAGMSSPVFDRLLDGGLRVWCNWDSYRKIRRADV